MLLHRLLHVFSVLAAVSVAALLGLHIGEYTEAGGLEALPYRMASTYAVAFAVTTTLISGLLASAWAACPRTDQRIAALLITAGFVAWPLFEIGTHIALGDGISQRLSPDVGRILFTLSLATVSTSLIATLAVYVASGWRKRLLGAVRAYRPQVRLALALLYLAGAVAMWMAPKALTLFGTRAILIYAWAVIFVSCSMLFFWRAHLWIDLALLLVVVWPAYDWHRQPEAARILASANAARFRPLSDVADSWPLHQDSSKPHYRLLAYDCSKASANKCGPSVGSTKHVILISVDALRKDALEWTRADGTALTPNIDRFAHQGLRYERATTNYPATLLALGSVVSGLSPIELTLAEKPPSIVKEAAKENISTHAIFPSSGWFSKKSFGRLVLDHFDSVQRPKTSDEAVDAALDVLRSTSQQERLFLWLHLYDPHEPYVHHPELGFERSVKGKYKGEVATTDAALGPLFDELQKKPWSDDTTVVFFSDHGESIGPEYVGHHVYLNRDIGDVPMIVRAPGVAPERSEKVTTMQDVTLTVRHALGLKNVCGAEKSYDLRSPAQIPSTRVVVAEAFSMRGSTLFRFLNTPVRSKQAIQSRLEKLDRPADYEPKTAVISSNYRSVFYHRSGRFELYDRRAKKEQALAGGTAASVRKKLKTHLRQWMQTAPLRASCLWRK